VGRVSIGFKEENWAKCKWETTYTFDILLSLFSTVSWYLKSTASERSIVQY
jgi:hypothetical protein